MELLLDTHALLWWLDGDKQLTDVARTAIQNVDNTIFISAASAWEITTKFRIGRLERARAVAGDVAATISSQGFGALPINVTHAQRAGSLPPPLNDPFDRILIAQSLIERMPLVSVETIFSQYGVQRVW